MIKKFHSENKNQTMDTPQKQEVQEAPAQKEAHKVRLFNDAPKPKSEPEATKPETPAPKRSPSVIFSNRVKSIQSDVISINEDFQRIVNGVREKEFSDLTLKNNDYLIIQNIYSEINFNDAAYQIEYGNDVSKGFQTIQGHLSDYAKIGKVDRILELGDIIIKLAKSIDIDIFNPNKIGTKISKFFGNNQQKTRKIKHDFDNASDLIDARINRVFDNLSEARKLLKDFESWSSQLTTLHHELQLKSIALKIKINEAENSGHSGQEALPSGFSQNNDVSLERWHRKVNTLFALNQSIMLTFPQIDLYQSNLLSSFERLEEIKVNIIQVWKQQFLTVIAVDESNDAVMYFELSDIQNQLVSNIQELK